MELNLNLENQRISSLISISSHTISILSHMISMLSSIFDQFCYLFLFFGGEGIYFLGGCCVDVLNASKSQGFQSPSGLRPPDVQKEYLSN